MLKAAAVSALLISLATQGLAASTPADILVKARKLQAAGRTYDAASILRSAALRYPEHVPLRIADQNAVINGGQYREWLEHYWSIYESSPTALNAYLFARIDYDRVRARETVLRAARTGTKHPGILWLAASRQAEDLAASGKHEAALKIIESSRAGAEAEPASVLQARAVLHAGMGKRDEARAMIDRAAKLDPQDAGIHAARLGILTLRGEMDELTTAIVNPPRNQWFAYVHAANAAAEERDGDVKRARESWRKVLEAPLDPFGWNFSRALAYDALGERDSALEEVRAALKLDPGDSGARLWLASDLGTRDRSAAEEIVRQELERNPRSVAALRAAAAVAFNHGRFNDAVDLYDKALALAPGIPELWVSRGAVWTHLKDPTQAEKSYREAERLAYRYPLLARERGRMHAEAGEYASCTQAMSRLALQEDAEVDDLRQYAYCCVGADHVERGIAAYHRAQKKIMSPSLAVDVAKDIAWAKGRLKESSARYPRDEKARRVEVKPARSLPDAPQAAYLEDGSLIFGAPWGKRLLVAEKSKKKIVGTQWAPDGKSLYVLADNAIRRIELPSLSSKTVIAEAPLAKLDALPRATFISWFEMLDRTGELALLTLHQEHGRSKYAEIVARPAAGGKGRVLHRRTDMRYIESARRGGKLFVFGGGNLRIDPSTGPALAYPLVGCNWDFRPSPDGRAMVCVSADAQTPENGELYLYDVDAAVKTPLEVSGRRPAWSHDGKSIAYVWRDRELRILDLGAKSVTAYALPYERDELSEFSGGLDARTDWSRDGRFVYLTIGPSTASSPNSTRPRSSVVVDLKENTAWIREGALPTFEWAPAPVPF